MATKVNLEESEELQFNARVDMDPRLQLLVARMRTGATKSASVSTAENEAAVLARVTDATAWTGLSEVRQPVVIGAADAVHSIVTGRIPVSRIERVRALPFVESLKAAQPMRPMLASATAETEARPVPCRPAGRGPAARVSSSVSSTMAVISRTATSASPTARPGCFRCGTKMAATVPPVRLDTVSSILPPTSIRL